MSGRDSVDAIRLMRGARAELRAAVEAAALPDGTIDPLLIDVELVERGRHNYELALDYYEESERADED